MDEGRVEIEATRPHRSQDRVAQPALGERLEVVAERVSVEERAETVHLLRQLRDLIAAQ